MATRYTRLTRNVTLAGAAFVAMLNSIDRSGTVIAQQFLIGIARWRGEYAVQNLIFAKREGGYRTLTAQQPLQGE